MLFDIYGRFQIEIERTPSGWVAYRRSHGLRRPCTDFVVPADLSEPEIATFLDDQFHEYAQPGAAIRRISTLR